MSGSQRWQIQSCKKKPIAPVLKSSPVLKLAFVHSYILGLSILSLLGFTLTGRVQAQTPPFPLPSEETLPSQQRPQPEPDINPALPPASDLLESVPDAPNLDESDPPPVLQGGAVFDIREFVVKGSTVFSDEALRQVTARFQGADKTFLDVAAARAAVTQLYIDEGYATSGAIVPPQQIENGVITLQIVEGSAPEIEVTGLQRLNSSYISSRLAVGAKAPLNVNQLEEQLELLQSDPLVESITADLQAGTTPNTNALAVSVEEADSFEVTYTLDNNRSPSVGTVRNQLRLSEGNLLGAGDRLSVGYALTRGSDGVDAEYTLPVSPYGTTLAATINISDSDVIENPFDVLDIESVSDFYQLTLRHPVWRTPKQEFALGLAASHQVAQTSLGIDDIGPFPLAAGADDQGRTRVSALRFFQEWTRRDTKQVLALRSQFNLGLDVLDATVNEEGPDGRFFSWQGQSQWVRVVAPDTLLLLKGSVQLSADSLLSLEQLNFGGQSTVRGYRQNLRSTDNGVLASAEARWPLLRDLEQNMSLHIAPFVDVGYGWNIDEETPEPLASVGAGLLFEWEELSTRIDWGIPLVASDSENRNSFQENGLYFTLQYSFF
ncbi:MAG: ShlB/FhaC/HecB family hemolysin secretion/activation protein [Cyanobacteria bacterium J06634_5]